MMDLILVRHALAGKPDAKKWPDDDLRPVTAKGRKAFKKAAKGLREAAEVTLILTSPVLRARETAEILAKALRLPRTAIADFSEAHHTRPPARALASLGRKRLPRTVAIVGHEPWLGEFLSLLLTGGPGAGLEFAKGGAACVRFGASRPAKGKGKLGWLMLPEQLAALS